MIETKTFRAPPGETTVILEGCPSRIVCCTHEHQSAPFPVPKYVNSLSDVPPNTQIIIIENGTHFQALCCLSCGGRTISLSGSRKGLVLQVISENGQMEERDSLIISKGKDLHGCMGQLMRNTLAAAGGSGKAALEKPALPDWLKTLGWEIPHSLSHDEILKTVQELNEKGLSPGFVLIGEGWQNLEFDKLSNFDADPLRFPTGLKGLIAELKTLGIEHVGVWHPVMGGRKGVADQLALEYHLPKDVQGHFYLGSELGKTFEFFHDYYNHLRKQGITFIKVGAQHTLGEFKNGETESTKLTRHIQLAIQAAASTQFNSPHLNGDCLCNENLFYWIISRIASSSEPIHYTSKTSIQEGIRNHLVNASWLQHLMLPDFGPWCGDSNFGEMVAVFQALSGSINVVKHPLSEKQSTFLHKMVFPDGKTIQADRPLTLCNDSLFVDPLKEKILYKAFTFKGQHGVLGVFNLHEDFGKIHGSISPTDIEGLEGDRFALFSHHNGFIGVLGQNESFEITLKPHQCDVFIFSPVVEGVAIMGSYLFYLSCAPITQIDIEEESVHLFSQVTAPLVAYCEKSILEVRCNGHAVPWEYERGRKILTIDSRRHLEDQPAIYSIYFES